MTQLLPAIFFLELDCFVLLQSDVKQKVITALQIVAFVYYCCNTLRLQPNKEKIFRKRSFYSSRGRFEEYIFGKGSRGGGGGGGGSLYRREFIFLFTYYDYFFFFLIWLKIDHYTAHPVEFLCCVRIVTEWCSTQ